MKYNLSTEYDMVWNILIDGDPVFCFVDTKLEYQLRTGTIVTRTLPRSETDLGSFNFWKVDAYHDSNEEKLRQLFLSFCRERKAEFSIPMMMSCMTSHNIVNALLKAGVPLELANDSIRVPLTTFGAEEDLHIKYCRNLGIQCVGNGMTTLVMGKDNIGIFRDMDSLISCVSSMAADQMKQCKKKTVKSESVG